MAQGSSHVHRTFHPNERRASAFAGCRPPPASHKSRPRTRTSVATRVATKSGGSPKRKRPRFIVLLSSLQFIRDYTLMCRTGIIYRAFLRKNKASTSMSGPPTCLALVQPEKTHRTKPLSNQPLLEGCHGFLEGFLLVCSGKLDSCWYTFGHNPLKMPPPH